LIEHGLTSPPTQLRDIRATGLQARTTLNNSSLFDIITVVAFASSLFLYSRDNEAVQKLNGVMSSGL